MYRPGMAEDWEPGEVRNTRSASRPSAPRPSDSRPSDPRVSVSRGSVPRPPAPRPPWNGWEAAREERERMMERIDGVNECIDGVNERIDGVSARLDEFAATTNARLEEQGVVLTQLKHMLAELLNRGEAARLRGGDDLEGDVDGGGVDGMGDGGDPMADEKLAQKLLAGRRAQMWDGPTTRAWWLLSGDLPKNSLQRTELRDLLSKKALVTAAVATQLQTLSGLDVGAFLPPGVDLDVATNLLIDRQMRVLGNSILLVVGEEASNAGRTRASQLSDAFNEGITLVEDHCMEQLASLQQPENRRNMVNLVNDDLRAWTLALHLASAAAARKWASPPGILDLPPIVVPSWRKLRAFIETGVILNDAPPPPPPPRPPQIGHPRGASEGRRSSAKRQRKEPTGACFQWGKKKTCRFGDLCMYSHGNES